jgi:hypothetical protein
LKGLMMASILRIGLSFLSSSAHGADAPGRPVQEPAHGITSPGFPGTRA